MVAPAIRCSLFFVFTINIGNYISFVPISEKWKTFGESSFHVEFEDVLSPHCGFELGWTLHLHIGFELSVHQADYHCEELILKYFSKSAHFHLQSEEYKYSTTHRCTRKRGNLGLAFIKWICMIVSITNFIYTLDIMIKAFRTEWCTLYFLDWIRMCLPCT